MKRNSFAVASVIGLSLVAVAFASRADQAKPGKPTDPALKEFMRAKLTASSEILEGLATEDFALIAAGAKKLGEISADEKWRISNDAIYRQHSDEFRRVINRLQEATKKENLDAAALTWIEATMSCIECHKHARTILIAGSQDAGR